MVLSPVQRCTPQCSRGTLAYTGYTLGRMAGTGFAGRCGLKKMESEMKYELRLGDKVLYEGEVAVVEGLMQTFAYVRKSDGECEMTCYERLQRA